MSLYCSPSIIRNGFIGKVAVKTPFLRKAGGENVLPKLLGNYTKLDENWENWTENQWDRTCGVMNLN